MGVSYSNISYKIDKKINILKAIDAYEEVLKVYLIGNYSIDRASTQCELGFLYTLLSNIRDKEDNILKTTSFYEKALKVYTVEKYPLFYATIQNNLGNAYSRLLKSLEDKDNLTKSIAAYEEALKFYNEEINPDMYRLIKDNLGKTYYNSTKNNNDENLKVLKDIRIVKNLEEIIIVDHVGEKYQNQLKCIVQRMYGNLTQDEQLRLCKTMRDMSKILDNYFYSPNELIKEILVLGSQVSQVEQEVKGFRFSKGKVCPLCSSETISRNGKYNGK